MSNALQDKPPVAKNSATVKDFHEVIALLCPKATVHIEPGGEKDGGVWLDIRENEVRVTAEWRPGVGIGIYHPGQNAYGTSPQEIFRNLPMAARRIRQLLRAQSPKPLGLRMLRNLLDLSQEDLASKLHVKQGAVSKLESRDDVKLQSLVNVVRAMGGDVEIRVHFTECELPILVPPQRKQAQSAKSRKEKVHA
jgi:DNA-binding XRE family transcriptional regulator